MEICSHRWCIGECRSSRSNLCSHIGNSGKPSTRLVEYTLAEIFQNSTSSTLNNANQSDILSSWLQMSYLDSEFPCEMKNQILWARPSMFREFPSQVNTCNPGCL